MSSIDRMSISGIRSFGQMEPQGRSASASREILAVQSTVGTFCVKWWHKRPRRVKPAAGMPATGRCGYGDNLVMQTTGDSVLQAANHHRGSQWCGKDGECCQNNVPFRGAPQRPWEGRIDDAFSSVLWL